MKYFIQTFGCKVSQYETQSMRETWQKNIDNAQELSLPDNADVLVIASCAVTREGVTDARQLCNKWKKNFPNAHIVVTGCAAEVAKNDFAEAHALIAQKNRHILLKHDPRELSGYYPPEKHLEYPPFSIENYKRSRPVIKVQDGCSHVCSYCIVPFARGGSRSRPLEAILYEIEILLEKGFRELVLSGVNLRQYAYNGLDFWDILNSIHTKFANDWEGRARFRLSSLEPAQLNEKGIEALTQSKLVAPHIHLSLQSGSQTVLERMNREHYELSQIEDMLGNLHKKWVKFGLGADFLMAFPQESEKEFQETLNFIDKIPFTYAHVFPYSPRPHTIAERMEGQLPKHVKQERTALVREKIQKKQKVFLEELLHEENLEVSFDVPHALQDRENNPTQKITGIDQYYNACILETQSVNHEITMVKPLSIEQNKIIVHI